MQAHMHVDRIFPTASDFECQNFRRCVGRWSSFLASSCFFFAGVGIHQGEIFIVVRHDTQPLPLSLSKLTALPEQGMLQSYCVTRCKVEAKKSGKWEESGSKAVEEKKGDEMEYG